jgi:ATP-binding cassette subfamily B protein
VQTVVGSSFSMGLRNLVMGAGALLMLVRTNPILMLEVVTVLVAVIFPSVYLGRRVRRLSRASQDRWPTPVPLLLKCSTPLLWCKATPQKTARPRRFVDSTARALGTALRRTRARAVLVGFIIMASSAVLLWGLYMGHPCCTRRHQHSRTAG